MNQTPRTTLLMAALLVVGSAASAGAQMLSVPVLQNAFANPGFTLAVNYGDSPGGQSVGGAAAWSPGGARFALSGGAASFSPEERGAVLTWGLRAMVPVRAFMEDAASVGVFAGIGGATLQLDRYTRVPAGASVGWRRALGETRAISLHAAPFADWWRLTPDEDPDAGNGDTEPATTATSNVRFRVGFGADLAITRSIGVTVGYETGAGGPTAWPGTGDVLGIGVSYALRARQ